ncbi:D-xylose-proton symporter [Pyrenophora tritici-repentis]|nr:D-xylose-proton symporter [Pyrenophora tritici-repentis]KAF7568655.1 hypothetical protein PtrM4_132680 [Pyrenophora tritici-repentis]
MAGSNKEMKIEPTVEEQHDRKASVMEDELARKERLARLTANVEGE